MEYLENDKDVLRLKGGVHEIDIYFKVEFNGKRKVMIRCEDDDSCTEDINGNWIDEYTMASFSPTIEDIDKIIEKLQKGKEFLMNDNKNNNMELKGKIFLVTPLETVNGKNGEWQKQTVVVEVENGKYPKMVAVEVVKDLTKWDYQAGREVSFEFDVESREWNGKWFTSAKAWKVNSLSKGENVTQDEFNKKVEENMPQNITSDDDDSQGLPF